MKCSARSRAGLWRKYRKSDDPIAERRAGDGHADGHVSSDHVILLWVKKEGHAVESMSFFCGWVLDLEGDIPVARIRAVLSSFPRRLGAFLSREEAHNAGVDLEGRAGSAVLAGKDVRPTWYWSQTRQPSTNTRLPMCKYWPQFSAVLSQVRPETSASLWRADRLDCSMGGWPATFLRIRWPYRGRSTSF